MRAASAPCKTAPFDFVTLPLSPLARLVVAVLDRTPRDKPECWLATKTIAAKLGRSVRTVQRALHELSAAGLIAIVRRYWLNSRRAIQLLWRNPPRNSDLNDIPGVPAPTDLSPSGDIPPDPPVCEPDGKDDTTVDPTAPSSSDLLARSEPTEQPAKPLPPLAPPEADPAVRAVIDRAVALWGLAPGVEARTVAACHEHPTEWVADAVEKAARKAAKEPTGWGFVRAILRNWSVEGGPSPAPARISTRPSGPTAAERAEADRKARLAARTEVAAEPTADERATFEAWATGASGPVLARLAVTVLGRLGRAPA